MCNQILKSVWEKTAFFVQVNTTRGIGKNLLFITISALLGLGSADNVGLA